MISHRMTFRQNSIIDLRVFPDIVTDTEKGCFDSFRIKKVEYPRGYLGIGAIIKREVNRIFGQ
jgi:hypothetical protein